MKNINDNYDFPKRLTLYLLLGYLVFTLLFSQPLSVVLSVVTNFRVNFAYINVFIGVIIILLVSRRSYIEASTILAVVFLIVSSFITFTFSGFESIISSISYIVQSISALLLISYSKSQRRNLSLKNMCWIFFIFTIPSIIIGFIQNISNSPVFLEYVLKSQDISLNTINNVWQFGDKTRAFGLFYTNGYYGFYLVFLIILFVCRIIFGRRRRILYVVLLAVLLVALYGTYTRTAYIDLALTVMLLPVISLARRLKFTALQAFTVFQTLAILFFAFVILYGDKNSSSSLLVNNQSISIRINNWAKIIDNIQHSPALVYGYGVSSNEVIVDKKITSSDKGTLGSVIVDNGYIATLISGGMILLAIQIFIQYSIFSILYKMFLKKQNSYTISVLAFYSGSTLYNLFGNLNSSILLIGIAFVVFGSQRGEE